MATTGTIGAAWVFTRSNGVWTQQGGKLVGIGAVGSAQQGHSVALSADGNTAIIGGYDNNSSVGAAWVFTRSSGVWTQQGNKLVGSGAVGAAQQGLSVALSADGNTAIVGGSLDNSIVGAAWVFTRSGGVGPSRATSWSARARLEASRQGTSVALSADGNTAIIGGPSDNASLERRGCSPAAAGCGRHKASSWSGTERLAAANQGRVCFACPPTATSPSSAG